MKLDFWLSLLSGSIIWGLGIYFIFRGFGLDHGLGVLGAFVLLEDLAKRMKK